jgi:hypothetical protein
MGLGQFFACYARYVVTKHTKGRAGPSRARPLPTRQSERRAGQKLPTSRTSEPGAIRSTACASRPATVQASGAAVGTGGGRQIPAAIGTLPVPARTATPAGDKQPAITPTAAGPPAPALARQAGERALRPRGIPPGRPVTGVAPLPRPRYSRRATTAAARAAMLLPRGLGCRGRHRSTDQPVAARPAKDRSAVTPPRLASHRRFTRRASSLPGTSARTAGHGRARSQARRIAAGCPAGHAGTTASLTRPGGSRPLARGITTVPVPSLATQCWRSATRRQTLLRPRPGKRSATAGRPAPGQLPPGRALSLAARPAAREGHPGGTALLLTQLDRKQPSQALSGPT